MEKHPNSGSREQGLRPLSARFDEALVMASSLHRLQARKGGRVPYVAHLLGVASLVLEEGGSEDMAIAALLHDAAEDQGGEEALEAIASVFGAAVARWVRQASDSLVFPKPEWETRKRHHLAQIPRADKEAQLIMLADKVYNARSILADHIRIGSEVWARFSVARERTVWYYEALLEVFERELSPALYDTLLDCVMRMKVLN
ncbi:MAG: phosphohydrolase [Acidobacteria bacterium]|nr:MAG: phosphohydrolase [Acidobacteriota bacterium]